MKRETAVVSYSIFEAQHSSGRVILLVGLQSYDTHLSVTFISDMQRTPKLYNVMFVSYGVTPGILYLVRLPTVRGICRSILNFDSLRGRPYKGRERS